VAGGDTPRELTDRDPERFGKLGGRDIPGHGVTFSTVGRLTSRPKA
jgi:hypothetical protein